MENPDGAVALYIVFGLFLVIWISSTIFGFGVARESTSFLVKATGYFQALSFASFGLLSVIFIYAVARETKSLSR